MSHFLSIKTEVRDLTALEQAVKELGLTLTYQGKVRGYSTTTADVVVNLKGSYDLGLNISEDGSYALVYDKYQGYVEKELGMDCQRLLQNYAVAKIEQDALWNGYLSQRESLEDGSIKIVLYQQ